MCHSHTHYPSLDVALYGLDGEMLDELLKTHYAELLQEFEAHWAELIASRGEGEPIPDRDSVCCGWLIQKVGSLQVIVTQLGREMNDLRTVVRMQHE